ncbi:hypothetical protein Ciccas_005583 [Cichlidogyrus casuarinus]|uniref:Uncharacterized protein n=1 Tax=Cichlidogyrus casuarinus TaxID=1844966 RepID=A0ABD2Q887_9PLAT
MVTRAVKKKPDYSRPHTVRRSIKPVMISGFQFSDGDKVYKGDVLVRQTGLKIYPGESVALAPDGWELIALDNGRFTISTEEISPFPDSPIYELVQSNPEPVKKTFANIIPDDASKNIAFQLKRFL